MDREQRSGQDGRIRYQNPRIRKIAPTPEEFFGDLREVGRRATEEFYQTVRVPTYELRHQNIR